MGLACIYGVSADDYHTRLIPGEGKRRAQRFSWGRGIISSVFEQAKLCKRAFIASYTKLHVFVQRAIEVDS